VTGVLPPVPGSGFRFLFTAHAVPTLRLAVPVMISRIGILVIVAVDTIMCARAGVDELAYYGLASLQVPMLLLGIGLLLGTAVLAAQAEGAGRPRDAGAVWRVAMIHALVVGCLLGAGTFAGEWFLLLTGQSPELAAGGGRTLAMFGFGIPGVLLYTCTVLFLEAIHRPNAGMVVMIAANVLNFLLNWMLIFGHLGAPEMGAAGAALATSIVRWVMFLAVAIYALAVIDRDHYGLTGPIDDALGLGRRLRHIGYPVAIATTLEATSFTAVTLFAGLLGAVHVAAYTLAINLIAIVFMAALGFSVAASVRVGNAVGRRDPRAAREAGWTATALAAVLLGGVSLPVIAFPELFARIYTADPVVLAVAVPTVLIAGFALLPDGLQVVLVGALRGFTDLWPATLLYLLSFWGVMVPLAWWLGVSREGGAPWLMATVIVGALVCTVLLALRFRVVTRRAEMDRPASTEPAS